MPSILSVLGYKVYFWSDEGNEPVHVHVTRGNPHKNATKIWLLSNGDVETNNISRYPKTDIRKIEKIIKSNRGMIIDRWVKFFGYLSYYK